MLFGFTSVFLTLIDWKKLYLAHVDATLSYTFNVLLMNDFVNLLKEVSLKVKCLGNTLCTSKASLV